MVAELIHELPHAQRLALSYASGESRGKVLALFALDARLAGILKSMREPLLAQLRLAWWRDNLVKPTHEWPQGDEVLNALSNWREPAGLRVLVSGWEALLDEQLTPEIIEAYVQGRSEAFACLARELCVAGTEGVQDAARIFVLADLASNISADDERQMVLEFARSQRAPRKLVRSLRSLAVLAGLGQLALDRGGLPLLDGPRSIFLALRIGLSGR